MASRRKAADPPAPSRSGALIVQPVVRGERLRPFEVAEPPEGWSPATVWDAAWQYADIVAEGSREVAIRAFQALAAEVDRLRGVVPGLIADRDGNPPPILSIRRQEIAERLGGLDRSRRHDPPPF